MFKRLTFVFVFIFAILICIPVKSFAASLLLIPNTNQGYVDVLVNAEGEFINGIAGEFYVTGGKIARIQDGGSIIKNWVQQPEVNESANNGTFSGIIPGGFSNYLNATGNDAYGLIFRIVINNTGTENKPITIGFKNIIATKNDGNGTSINISNKILNTTFSNTSNYELTDTTVPNINYKIVKDPNLFDGHRALVFSVTDDRSGVKEVFIKEGRGEFLPASNPYLIKNKSGLIVLRAVDNAGNTNEVIVRNNVVSYFRTAWSSNTVKIIASLLFLVILSLIVSKKLKK